MTSAIRGTATGIATLAGTALAIWAAGIEAQTAPAYFPDPAWPRPLPNNWKFGGITGLAVDADGHVWVLNRPNDLADMELLAELAPPVSQCCTRPPSMLHFDRSGNVIGWFDPAQGHGMDVDDEGFVYIGQDTVRKYGPGTGEILAEVARTPEREGGGPVGLPPPVERIPGQGTLEHADVFMPSSPPDPARRTEQAAAAAAFREKYPPGTPMVVGGIEEIRIVEADNEMYVADNYLGGRVLVFDLDAFEFKRGWGAYGKPLAEISIDDGRSPVFAERPDAARLRRTFDPEHLQRRPRIRGRPPCQPHSRHHQGRVSSCRNLCLRRTPVAADRRGDVAFSPDPEQRYLYVSDRMNNKIWFLNRENGEVVGELGSMGEAGGQFFGLHMIAVDSEGYIYTGEVDSFRVQRFAPSNTPGGQLLQQLAEMP